jgi:hypothetical protein
MFTIGTYLCRLKETHNRPAESRTLLVQLNQGAGQHRGVTVVPARVMKPWNGADVVDLWRLFV